MLARRSRASSTWVKASPPAVPGQPVLMPGEVERQHARARGWPTASPLDDKTWADLLDAAQSVGIAAARVERDRRLIDALGQFDSGDRTLR